MFSPSFNCCKSFRHLAGFICRCWGNERKQTFKDKKRSKIKKRKRLILGRFMRLYVGPFCCVQKINSDFWNANSPSHEKKERGVSEIRKKELKSGKWERIIRIRNTTAARWLKKKRGNIQSEKGKLAKF